MRPYHWKTVKIQDSKIFWVSQKSLFLQQRISDRVLKYQLNFKPMNHAMSKQNNHHFQAPSPTVTSWAAGSLQGWWCSGVLEFAINNWPHLKQPHSRALWCATGRVLNYCLIKGSLCICQSLLLQQRKVRLPAALAAQCSTVPPMLLPAVKQQCDSSDTQQLPQNVFLLPWAWESVPSATPCSMSHLPF